MSEVSAPQRKKGGRPRKHAPDAKRLSMTFRVNESLHAKIEASAHGNGRSLSEEIERLLENYFERGENMSLGAQKAVAAAVLSAAETVRAKIDEEYADLFGGKPFLWMAKEMADLFQKALIDTAKERGLDNLDKISKADAGILVERLASGQAKIVDEWFQRAQIAKALSKLSADTMELTRNFMEKPEGAYMKRASEEEIWRSVNSKNIEGERK